MTMVHPPRIQARIDASKPVLLWFTQQGLVRPASPILDSWALIDAYRVTMKPSYDDLTVTACFTYKAGQHGAYTTNYEQTGLSSLEAALKAIKARIEAEGKGWIEEIANHELQQG